jgi:hypothetical protein
MASRRSTRLPENRRMIEGHTEEGCGVMTNITRFIRYNMAWPLTRSDNAIVTIGT